MSHPASAYRQFSVQGATPLGLVVMLYDGAIASLRCAVASIEAQDTQNKCHHLNRALAIIAQLDGTLDLARGGEVARTLKSLYSYARARIFKGNLENSAPALLSLIENLATVREAWAQADRLPSPSTPPPCVEGAGRLHSPARPADSWQVSG
jgi:flagellar secretion chaperone FliS